MTTAQVQFTQEELLADLPVAEPLSPVASGATAASTPTVATCPRARDSARPPSRHGAHSTERLFSTELIDPPLDWWERSYPNVDQARFLVRAGVPEPLMATLTRIGTVEGYGANIRLLKPKDLQRHFAEDIRGTAIDHLGGGLFEAHGRDEAGWEAEAGHRDMWFAAPRHRLRAAARGSRHRGHAGSHGLRWRKAGRRDRTPAARRHLSRARDDGDVDGPGPLHRDLRLPYLRLGRGVDVRHRAGGR